jgi:hypothetical protein
LDGKSAPATLRYETLKKLEMASVIKLASYQTPCETLNRPKLEISRTKHTDYETLNDEDTEEADKLLDVRR